MASPPETSTPQDPDRYPGRPEHQAEWATIVRVRRRRIDPRINLLLLLATIYTTLIAGTFLTLDDWVISVLWSPSTWGPALSYSFCVILILGAHEMGHYFACRYYRIDATLPFFLPAPPPLGTFGAVIRIRSPFTNSVALFDVGVAGPIAGFIVAIPVLVYGLMNSTPVHEPIVSGVIVFRPCLLLDLLYPVFLPLESGEAIRLPPSVAAAWLGLFATALNLLPIGQLDGGHMLYAISRPLHRLVSTWGIAVLILTGFLLEGYHLVLFGIIFGFLGPRHPPTLDDMRSLGSGRLVVAFLGLVIFILCFIPHQPIEIYGPALP